MPERELPPQLNEAAVSRETSEKLHQYLKILDEWRVRLNLIGRSEWERIWERHILDCHQLRKYIPESAHVVDIGSGAGFPGVVLASSASSSGKVILVESSSKKCKFLQAVAEHTKLPISIINSRIESVGKIHANFVTARAVAPLDKLIEYVSPLLDTGAVALLHKGEKFKDELENVEVSWKLDYKVLPNEYSSNGVILKISGAKRDRQTLSSACSRQPERRRGQNHNSSKSRNGVRRRR